MSSSQTTPPLRPQPTTQRRQLRISLFLSLKLSSSLLINLLNMPPLSVGAVVLVTGASGFIGTHVVRALDQAGFWVRATVRSKEKGKYLKTLVSGIEVVVVPDMSAVSARGERLWDDLPCRPLGWHSHVLPPSLSPFSILHPLPLSPPLRSS